MKTNISNTASLLLCICSLVVSSCCREEQPCVSLTFPANGATNVAPGNQTLTWSTSCPAADSFEVVLSPSSTFAASTTNGAPIYSQTYRVRGTSYTVGVEMNGIYYWRVRPLNAGVSQAWSPTFRFDAVDNMTARLGVYNNMTMEGWFYQGRTPYRDISQDRTGSVTITRSENHFDAMVLQIQNSPSTLDKVEYLSVQVNDYASTYLPFFFFASFNKGITQDSVEIDYPIYQGTGINLGFLGNFFKIKGKK